VHVFNSSSVKVRSVCVAAFTSTDKVPVTVATEQMGCSPSVQVRTRANRYIHRVAIYASDYRVVVDDV
jgi:hypothetical protein